MEPIGNTFTILKTVDSTNNYAMARVHAGLARHGDSYFSLEQTAGKGQRGRVWNSATGENIILTCILEPVQGMLERQFTLSSIIALACYDFVNHYSKTETTVKWPNDIYWRDRKAGGILIENSIKGSHWRYAVAGIGINVNQTVFAKDLRNPVSLKQITGNTFDVIELGKQLCLFIQSRWDYFHDYGSGKLLLAYNEILYQREKNVILKRNNQPFETTIKGVNSEGCLITSGGKEEVFSWGEVEWVS